MRIVSWIIMVPVAVVVAVFAASNRGSLTLELWPLPYAAEAPVFAVVLASVLAGFGGGALVAWMSAGKARRRARLKAAETESARREVERLREKVARLEAAAREASSQGAFAGDTPATPEGAFAGDTPQEKERLPAPAGAA